MTGRLEAWTFYPADPELTDLAVVHGVHCQARFGRRTGTRSAYELLTEDVGLELPDAADEDSIEQYGFVVGRPAELAHFSDWVERRLRELKDEIDELGGWRDE